MILRISPKISGEADSMATIPQSFPERGTTPKTSANDGMSITESCTAADTASASNIIGFENKPTFMSGISDLMPNAWNSCDSDNTAKHMVSAALGPAKRLPIKYAASEAQPIKIPSIAISSPSAQPNRLLSLCQEGIKNYVTAFQFNIAISLRV